MHGGSRVRAIGGFLVMAACTVSGCSLGQSAAAQSRAFTVPNILEIEGWHVLCASSQTSRAYECTMSRTITGVGTFRVILSPDAIELLSPNCGDSAPGVTTRIHRAGALGSQAAEVFQRIWTIVETCNQTSLDELDKTPGVFSLIMRATD